MSQSAHSPTLVGGSVVSHCPRLFVPFLNTQKKTDPAGGCKQRAKYGRSLPQRHWRHGTKKTSSPDENPSADLIRRSFMRLAQKHLELGSSSSSSDRLDRRPDATAPSTAVGEAFYKRRLQHSAGPSPQLLGAVMDRIINHGRESRSFRQDADDRVAR